MNLAIEILNKEIERREILLAVENNVLIQNDMSNEIGVLKDSVKNLALSGVGSSFICVKDQKPPKNTELIAQDPKGGNYLTSWRESYSIFMCQSKQEDSYNWKWKQI
jgi:hypothetical protein